MSNNLISCESRWQIPDDTEKPDDGRIISGKYATSTEPKAFKTLPIGISDYARTQSQYYYVDKTLMIKDFLDQKPLVSLFTRPRRFGKTLNMDMLRVFFEISDEDTSKYFLTVISLFSTKKNIFQESLMEPHLK